MKRISRISAVLIVFLAVAFAGHAQEVQRERIVYAASVWAPYVTVDEEGNPHGIFMDLLTELFTKKLGHEVEFLDVPWKRAQYELQNGTADITITLPTKERLEYVVPSKIPLINLYLHIFTQADHPLIADIQTISSAADIKKLGLVPVTNIGNGWHKNEIDSQGIKTEYVPNEENSFQMVANKRADITIEPLFAGQYLVNKLGMQEKIVATQASFGPLSFHVLVSKKSRYSNRMQEIDRALAELVASKRVQTVLDFFEKKQASRGKLQHQQD